MKIEAPFYFYYIAPIKNLASILSLGIFSHNESRKKKLVAEDISNLEVQLLRSQRAISINGNKHNLHDLINLYLNPNNQMMGRLSYDKKLEEIVVLKVNGHDLIERGEWVVSNGNAARGDTQEFWGHSDIGKAEILRLLRDSNSRRNDGKKAKREFREFLYASPVPAEAIIEILCFNNQSKKNVDTLLNQKKYQLELQ